MIQCSVTERLEHASSVYVHTVFTAYTNTCAQVTESPQQAGFRRHLKMLNRYMGMDASLANGEDEYDAAYRIWSMFPTDRSGLEPYADADEADGEEGAEGEGEGEAGEGSDAVGRDGDRLEDGGTDDDATSS